MSRRAGGERVIQALALFLVTSALAFGQTGCDDGETFECVNEDVSCVQEVLDEAACTQRAYCTLGPGCQATACSPLVSDEAACRASGVCDWNSAPELGAVGCSFSPAWSACQYADTEATCTAQHAGCNWEQTCVVKPRDCGKVDDQATCESHPGCKWEQGTGRFYLG